MNILSGHLIYIMEGLFEQKDVLLTTPDLPLNDSFPSLELNESPRSEGSVGFFEETDAPKPKQPYVTRQANIRQKEAPTAKEDKIFILPTETTYMSGATKKECVVNKDMVKPLQIKTNESLHHKVLGRNFMRKIEQNTQSHLLKNYWQKKSQIEDRYKTMISKIDKELAIELRLNISNVDVTIEKLMDIKEYYEDSKVLLNAQRVCELEELLKEFQMKIKEVH